MNIDTLQLIKQKKNPSSKKTNEALKYWEATLQTELNILAKAFGATETHLESEIQTLRTQMDKSEKKWKGWWKSEKKRKEQAKSSTK